MASDGDVARLIDPVLEAPLAIALVVIAVAASSWRRRISTDPAKPGSPPTEGAGVPDRLRGARRMAFAIGLVAMALRVPWSPPEPMDHLEYALVVETDLAETWRDVLVNRVGIEQAHQPLSRVPIALARHLGLRPETTRWFQLAAWGLALAGAWCWTRLLAGSWTGALGRTRRRGGAGELRVGGVGATRRPLRLRRDALRESSWRSRGGER